VGDFPAVMNGVSRFSIMDVMTNTAKRGLGSRCGVFIIGAMALGCSVAVTVDEEKVSPGGEYIATSASIDAGAGTSLTKIVTLRKAGAPFNRFQGKVFVVTRALAVKVRWTAPSTLVIRCVDCDPSRIESNETKWQSVTIGYESVPKAQE
jgi:hypothetical protein